jgi:predicted 2-oxoglutarate/Fe(II)-dependent dioxygenase YbiX
MLSSPQVTHLGHEIFLFEQLLEPTLCRHIIEVAELSQYERAGIELQQLDATIRNNAQLCLNGTSLLESTNQLLLHKVGIIQHWLHQHYGIRFAHSEICSVLRYSPGEFYKRHVDNLLKPSRQEEASLSIPTRDISVVGYLNDDFTGGETYFDRQALNVEPEQGAVLVFPSFFIYPHQSRPVVEGRKFAFTTWLYHCN